MFGLSKKEIENRPTQIRKKDNFASFMNLSNQRHLTKKIYLLHKSNNGLLTYLHFKDIVPLKMKEWIQKKDINKYRATISAVIDMLDYLNKLFISDNYELYTIMGYEVPNIDSNVYRNKLLISYITDDDNTLVIEKRPEEMLVEDIRNLDVWAEQTIEVSNKNRRYNNQIVPWQASMHTRNYDRTNQGYAHADPTRASLETPIYGYGDEIKKLHKLVDNQLKKNQLIKNYI